MATSAERQRAYRQRHLTDADGSGARINTVIGHGAKLSLERLASCYCVTQRTMIERLIAEAEGALLAELSGQEQGEYYDKCLTLTESDQG